MSGSLVPVPSLRVSSREISDPGPLDALLDARHPLILVRHGSGAAGFGEAARFEFAGETRFTDAAATWRRLVDAARIENDLDIPGSGLVAAGSFTFAADSADRSRLVIPSVVIGRRGGRAWITTIDGAADPLPEDQGAEFTVEFTQGDPSRYTTSVAAAVELIRGSTLRKVVLARSITGELPDGADLRRAISRLATRYPDALTFAVDGLIGASPETLVRVEDGHASARVLAGTAARGPGARDELLASAKDRDEHDHARRSVIEALTPHVVELTVHDPFVLELPNLLHIASDVDGVLADGSSSLDLVAAMHPTAAVAGTPTDEAILAIASLEGFDRRRYAGPVGWIAADGSGEWAVALRCAEVDHTTITAYAGAGIVEGSEPAKELAETQLKFRPIVDAFG
ncbi:MAG: chorismate-binding protein [Rhodoglobus sp.]